MLSGAFLVQIAGVFGTGLAASVSPCVYPMIPITVGFLGSQASGTHRKRSVLLYVLGQALTLVAIGVLAVQLGETLGFTSQTPVVSYAVGGFLVVFGLFLYIGKIPRFVGSINFLSDKVAAQKGSGPMAAFILGVSAALVASPCTSPILGGVLTMMASSSTVAEGVVLMSFYSLGFSVIFLVLGLGVLSLNSLPKTGPWLNRIHKLSGIVLMSIGAYYFYAA